MKQKNLAMLGVAVGCGLVAAVAVAKLSAGGSRGPDTVKVLVAKKDLPLSTKLDEKDIDTLIVWADMPKNLVPPDAATDLEQVKGKSLHRTLKQGNPVSISDVGEAKELILPDGSKGFSVKVDQVGAVAGFAKPGSIVDIMYVERMSSGKARSAVILKQMRILAVNAINVLDEKTGAAIPQVESVTLAVNRKQAERLAFAQEKGKVMLLLTSGESREEADKFNDGAIAWTEDPFDAKATVAPVVVPPAAPKLDLVVVVKKAVPQNTLINADNVNEFFTTLEVKTAPQGAYTNVDDLKGKFIAKNLDEGQTLFKTLTQDKTTEVVKPVEPKTPVTPVTPAVVVEKKKFPRFEQVIQEGGKTKRVIWLEISPDRWKKFDTDKDAEEYKPTADATKADETKGESSKVTGE